MWNIRDSLRNLAYLKFKKKRRSHKASGESKRCYNNFMLFGRDTAGERTVLILDVESGSVGSALARVAPGQAPHILGEFRSHARLSHGRSAEQLAVDTLRLTREALLAASELAARLRHQGKRDLGTVSNIDAFLSPPWGRPNLALGAPEFLPHMKEKLAEEARILFDAPVDYHTAAGAAVAGMRAAAPFESDYLLVLVTHEMTEILRIHGGTVVGHATVPHGINLALRTLHTHDDISERAARTALFEGTHEALPHAAAHYAGEFAAAARELLGDSAPERVWVVSPHGEFFAKALSHESLSPIFSEGGVVRALSPVHMRSRLSSAGGDLLLILEAVFIGYTL